MRIIKDLRSRLIQKSVTLLCCVLFVPEYPATPWSSNFLFVFLYLVKKQTTSYSQPEHCKPLLKFCSSHQALSSSYHVLWASFSSHLDNLSIFYKADLSLMTASLNFLSCQAGPAKTSLFFLFYFVPFILLLLIAYIYIVLFLSRYQSALGRRYQH